MMRRRVLTVPALALAAVVLLGACGTGANSAGGSGTSDDGGTLPDADVAGTDVTGVWGDTTNPEAPSLEFDPSGRVSGTDGCNRLMGFWSIEGTRVTLRDMASTMMFCHGIDTWLSGGAAADVDGGTLRVYDQAGTEIGSLARPNPGS